jgi:hypothetical protein
MNFKLKARVNRSDARTIRHALEQLSANGSVRKAGDEFVVEAEMEGASAKELNRSLLSALRKVEKRTTLRAEWSSGDRTERFFDYVLKKTVKNWPAIVRLGGWVRLPFRKPLLRAIRLPRGVQRGWGVSEALAAFVTTIATTSPEYRR